MFLLKNDEHYQSWLKRNPDGDYWDFIQSEYKGHAFRHTHDFITLYCYAMGRGETPIEFHQWAAVSLLAAAARSRYYLEIIRGQPLYPHIYTMLVAPSGIGKGVAITNARRMWNRSDLLPAIAMKSNISYKALWDELSEAWDKDEGHSPYWLCHDELGEAVEEGTMAKRFAKTMTDLFSSANEEAKERTRAHGLKLVNRPVINWIAGTTPKWLVETFGTSMIAGGLTARVLFVYPQERLNKDVRIFEPYYPEDVEEVETHLGAALRSIRFFFEPGRVEFTPKAKELFRYYYESKEARPRPDDEQYQPNFNRWREIVGKLCILMAVSDLGLEVPRHSGNGSEPVERPKINEAQVKKAIQLYKQAEISFPTVIRYSQATHQTKLGDALDRFMNKQVKATRGDVTKYMRSTHNVIVGEWEWAMNSLIEEGLVRVSKEGPKGKPLEYEYLGKLD